MDSTRMSAIAERFPSLRGVAGVRPFDVVLLLTSYRGTSHGQQCAIRFLLGLWNAGYWVGRRRRGGPPPFDLHEARSVWDAEHVEAFRAFVAQDWGFWP